jgi:putative hemolysin
MPSSAELLLVPLLIALSAFFVASEYVVVTMRPSQIEELKKRAWRFTAWSVDSLKAQPARAIAALQICLTVSGLLLGSFGEPVMARLLEAAFGRLVEVGSAFHIAAGALSFALVTLLTVVFSELLPKALTLRYVPYVAILTAVPTYWILRATKPFVWLMHRMANLATVPLGLGRVEDMEAATSHSPDEIRLMTHEAADTGSLSEQERSVILNALSLGRRPAKQIMVPRVRVAYLDLQRDMNENRSVMNEHLYSRLPLCDGGMDRVIGVVHTKEFLSAYNAEGDSSVLGLIARPPLFAPESIALDQLLVLFDRKKAQMAFLVDEHGGVEGLVTLRDVVDELVGEPLEIGGAETLDGRLELAGETPLHETREALGKPDWGADETVLTIGGLIASRLGRIPRPGEEVEVEGVNIRVVESDARAVRKVSVKYDGLLRAEGSGEQE